MEPLGKSLAPGAVPLKSKVSLPLLGPSTHYTQQSYKVKALGLWGPGVAAVGMEY